MLFEPPRLSPQDRRVVERLRELRGQLRYQVAERHRWVGVLRRVSMARAIRSSNSIEGYHVSIEDAAALVDRQEPEDAIDETRAAVEGYRDAMSYILQAADDPHVELGAQLLLSLHFMMTKHDLDARPGRWRTGAVYVRDAQTGEVVYEGAPANEVPGLVRELVEALATSSDVPPTVGAAMAHLNLVMVHPFKDGNGRMARALQSRVLVREGILGPEFCSIEEELGRDARRYYDVLAEVGGARWEPGRDARPWIRYCLDAHHRQMQRLLRRVTEAERAWMELEHLASSYDIPDRALEPLLEATAGRYLRNSTYRVLAAVNEQKATRDLKRLVAAGLLVADGAGRGRRYRAGAPLTDIYRQVTVGRADTFHDVYEVVG